MSPEKSIEVSFDNAFVMYKPRQDSPLIHGLADVLKIRVFRLRKHNDVKFKR